MNKIMKKIKIMMITLLICLISISVFGCNKKNKITICEVTHSVFYAPLYVSIELGFFEEVGLDIELINGNGADKVMATLLSGDAQIGLMGPEASIYVYTGGQENYAVNFAQLTRTDGSFIIGREKDETFNLNKLAGKSILGGRQGGVPEMTLEYVLKKTGLLVGRDDESVLEKGGVLVRTDVQFAAMAGAFSQGEGDYTTLFEPTATSIENSGKGYILASVGELAGDVPYTAFSALKDYINNNEEKIQLFTDALYKGLVWVHTNSAEKVAEVIAPQFSSISLSELIEVTQRHKDINAWVQTPLFTETALNNLVKIMKEAKELDENVPYDKIVTTKFVEKTLTK